ERRLRRRQWRRRGAAGRGERDDVLRQRPWRLVRVEERRLAQEVERRNGREQVVQPCAACRGERQRGDDGEAERAARRARRRDRTSHGLAPPTLPAHGEIKECQRAPPP